MLPIILVLGATGALLEIKRLIARPPKDGDLLRLRQSEEQLKRVLQVSEDNASQSSSPTVLVLVFLGNSSRLLLAYNDRS